MVDEYQLISEDSNFEYKPKRRSFAADVFTLTGGTALAMVIPIIVTPIITRIYGADAYGTSALFTSIVSIITVVSCLRYELSIMLPKKVEDAANQLALSIFIVMILSVLMIPLIWLFGDTLLRITNAGEVKSYSWLMPPMVFFGGLYLAMNYWNSRTRRFKSLSAAQVTKSVALSGTQLGAGISGYANGGSLIGANVLSQAAATMLLGFHIWKSDWKLLKRSISWRGMISGLKQYRNFPIYDVWSALINALSVQLPIFIITAYFTSTMVGYYSLGLSILQLPMTFIGSAIAQVFFQRAAEAINRSEQDLRTIVESTFGRLISIGFMPLLLIAIIGKDLFIFVFGVSWAEAGIYAQILAPLVFLRFIYSPISTLFTIYKKLRAFLIFNIVLVFVSIGSLIWGGINNSIYVGLTLFSIIGGLVYIFFTYWILSTTKISFVNSIKPIMTFVFIGALFSTILFALKYALELDIFSTVTIAAILLCTYYYVIFIYDKQINSTVLEIIGR